MTSRNGVYLSVYNLWCYPTACISCDAVKSIAEQQQRSPSSTYSLLFFSGSWHVVSIPFLFLSPLSSMEAQAKGGFKRLSNLSMVGGAAASVGEASSAELRFSRAQVLYLISCIGVFFCAPPPPPTLRPALPLYPDLHYCQRNSPLYLPAL